MKHKSIISLLKTKALIITLGMLFIFQACEKNEIVKNDNILVTEELLQDNELQFRL
jgi:ribose/xylose/arabinose/galactoside ABC-type transport system permease subunit